MADALHQPTLAQGPEWPWGGSWRHSSQLRPPLTSQPLQVAAAEVAAEKVPAERVAAQKATAEQAYSSMCGHLEEIHPACCLY